MFSGIFALNLQTVLKERHPAPNTHALKHQIKLSHGSKQRESFEKEQTNVWIIFLRLIYRFI